MLFRNASKSEEIFVYFCSRVSIMCSWPYYIFACVILLFFRLEIFVFFTLCNFYFFHYIKSVVILSILYFKKYKYILIKIDFIVLHSTKQNPRFQLKFSNKYSKRFCIFTRGDIIFSFVVLLCFHRLSKCYLFYTVQVLHFPLD